MLKGAFLSVGMGAALVVTTGAGAHEREGNASAASTSSVAEFASACRNLDAIETIRQQLVKNGWKEAVLDDHPVIVTAHGEWEAGQGQNADLREVTRLYSKPFEGRDLFLLLYDFDLSAGVYRRITLCELFDFTRAPTIDELDMVLGSQKVEKRHEHHFRNNTPDSLWGVSWHAPFSLSGSSSNRIQTVPAKYHGRLYVKYEARKSYYRERDRSKPLLPPPPPIKIPETS